MEMSSAEMDAFGDKSASGCGSVVFRLPQKGSGKPVSLLVGRILEGLRGGFGAREPIVSILDQLESLVLRGLGKNGVELPQSV